MADPNDSFYLLLARAGDHAPMLPEGLPQSALLAPDHPEPELESVPVPSRALIPSAPGGGGPDNAGDMPDDAPAPPPPLLWGVIAPAGPVGDRLLGLIDKLIKAREAQQRAPARVYRVPAQATPMTMAEAIAWRKASYDSGADLGVDRPRFQLILGDLDQVPLAIQQVQAIDGYVGRLCFADESGYGAYVDKVLRAEAKARHKYARLVMHTARDGSVPLELGWSALAAPGEALLRAELAQSSYPASEILSHGEPSKPGLAVLLERASSPDPGVLFTMSHGLGPPYQGWGTPEEQRAQQGAMVLGVEAQLGGADVATGPFMPDGLWLMFACFGAGTPSMSAYQRWLQQAPGRVSDVARSLALGAPFIAALPQRALANPDGPLAFIGHVDLAWTFSFREAGDSSKARPGRFMRVLKSALEAKQVGVALQELAAFVVETDTELTLSYVGTDTLGPAALQERALLWLTRQDLAGFILLGDPAVRLPVLPLVAASLDDGAPQPVGSAPPSLTFVGGAPPPPAGDLERAVGRVLAGDKTVAEAAAEQGIDPARLEAAVAAYRQAGRRALGRDA
jgi:hypothetical protein